MFTRGRRSSLHQVDNQYTCQITTWVAFFVQKLAPPCTRAGVVGKETGVRAPCVHLFSSCMSPTYVGVCERDTNLDIMRRPSPCLRPVRPPVTTTPHSSSPYLSSFSLHFYIQGHYQNYNLQIYKATNTNRCNINGVCLVVLVKEDINYPLHACGSESIGLMCMKEKNTH